MHQLFTFDSLKIRLFLSRWLYFLGLEINETKQFRVNELPAKNTWFELTFEGVKKSKNGKQLTDIQVTKISFQLLFIWISRLFLLKNIEKNLLLMHENETKYNFLSFEKLPNFESIENLISEVIYRQQTSRIGNEKTLFGHLPYINHLLFERHSLEKQYLSLSDVKNNVEFFPLTQKQLPSIEPTPFVQHLLELLDTPHQQSELFQLLNGLLESPFPLYTDAFLLDFWKFNNITQSKQKIIFPTRTSPQIWQTLLFQHLLTVVKNKQLTDEDKRQIIDYEFEVINGELVLIDIRDGELFQYFAPNPIQKKTYQHALTGKTIVMEEGRSKSQRQKVQEAIFYAKQSFLQSQLFLIEKDEFTVLFHHFYVGLMLIDHCFYTQESEYRAWNLLPNYQRNLKKANIFDSSLELSLKISTQIAEYKVEWRAFEQTIIKKEQQKIIQNIQQIQQEWRLAWAKKEGKYAKWQKLQAEFYRKYADTGFFSFELSEQEETEKLKLQTDILILAQEIGMKPVQDGNNIELRWDYPEVWDNKGNFLGFDVVVSVLEEDETPQNLQLSHKISKKEGFFIAIYPDSFRYKPHYSAHRSFFFEQVDLTALELSNEYVWAVAKNKTTISPNFSAQFGAKTFAKTYFDAPNFGEISLHLPEVVLEILHKIEKNATPLKEIAEIKRGATIKKGDLVNTAGMKMLIGQNVQQYQISFENLHISTAHKEFARLKDFFEADNIVYLNRNATELIAAVGDERFAFNKNLYGLIFPHHVDKYVALALLNSPLLSAYYQLKFQTWQDYSQNEIQASLCERLPIILPDENTSKQLSKSVLELIKAFSSENMTEIATYQQSIFSLILKTYQLTDSEFQQLKAYL